MPIKKSLYAFPKRCILANATEFRELFKSGKKIKTHCFAIHTKQNQLAYPRLGLVVSKKAVRLAVHRNRIKRIIRESFRHNQQFLTGFDTIVVVYHTINAVDKKSLRNLLDKQWLKLASR